MNRESRGILVGLALGDGYIHLQRDKRYPDSLPTATLVIKHAARQRAYAEYKANLVHRVLGGKLPKVADIDNNGHPGIIFRKSDKYFRVIRKRLYSAGKKKITSQILDHLTDRALALWWMDDGSLYMRKRDGRVHGRQGVLSLYSTHEEALLVQDWFLTKYGVNTLVGEHKGRYRLFFNAKALNQLTGIISEYVIPEMVYKVDMKYVRPSYLARVPSTVLALKQAASGDDIVRSSVKIESGDKELHENITRA